MKGRPAANPDDYVSALDGWRRACVVRLRDAVRSERRLDEQIKWGHLVYLFDGPVLLIRAEDERVLFGFWRGKRLVDLEPRLEPSGKYEMATVELRDGDAVRPVTARRLAKAACNLNVELGDPRQAARSGSRRPTRSRRRR